MTTDIIIRPTIKEDLPAIRNILNDVIAGTDYYLSEKLKTAKDMERWFDEHQDDDRYFALTALCGNDFAGWVSLSSFRKADGYNISAELSIYVHPEHHRKGIADKLIWTIEDVAYKKGLIHCIISVITANNTASIALHEKHGYKTTGIFKEIAYKNGAYRDVVMMSKLLVRPDSESSKL